jgi:hypothetical protein
MSTASGEDQIIKRLTARERARAEFLAYQADQEPDPRLWRLMPPEQARSYAADAAWLLEVHETGGAMLVALQARLAELEARVGWWQSLCLVTRHREALQEVFDEGAAQEDPLRAAVARHLAALEFLNTGIDASADDNRRLGIPLREGVIVGVRTVQQELQGLEDELSAIATTFDCADVLLPDRRLLLQDCLARVTALQHPQGFPDPIAWEEPSDELRAAIREGLRPL